LITLARQRINKSHKKPFLTLVLVDMGFLAMRALEVPWFLPYIVPWFSIGGAFFLVRLWEIVKRSRSKGIQALCYGWILFVGVNPLVTSLPSIACTT